MSLEVGSGSNDAAEDIKPSAQSTASMAGGAQQQQRAYQAESPTVGGLDSLRRAMAAPMTRSTAGEAVNRFKAAIEKILEKEGDGAKALRVLVLDGRIRGSALSSILLVRHAEGKAAVANLIVAASEPNLPNTEIKTGNGGTIELPTVPGAINDRPYWDKIRTVVREAIGNVEPVYAGANVIPVEMSPDDEGRLRSLIYYTDCGIYNTLLMASGVNPQPFNVGMLLDNTIKITSRRNFAPEPVETVTGLPVRADIVINTVASENSKNPLDASAMPLALVCAMVDLIYCPPEPAGVGQIQSTTHYLPHIIATKIEPVTDRVGLEQQLFAILQLPLLAKNYSWANCYRRREAIKGLDSRDVGAIGFDVPNFAGRTDGVPTRIDTKSAAFTTEMFLNLIQTAIRRDPVISIDIEDTGEMSWLNALFVAAANGVEAANNAIIQAFDNLTMGHFSKYYRGGPLFVDNGTLIHFGYYINEGDGTRHDIRDVDYLAYLNVAGQSETKAVRDFEDTFDSSQRDPLLRLEKRLELTTRVTGPSIRITGTGRRITIHPDTIAAGVDALVATGLVINPDNAYTDLTGNGRRGNAMFSRLAFSGQGQDQLFAHSMPTGMGMGNTNFTMFAGYR